MFIIWRLVYSRNYPSGRVKLLFFFLVSLSIYISRFLWLAGTDRHFHDNFPTAEADGIANEGEKYGDNNYDNDDNAAWMGTSDEIKTDDEVTGEEMKTINKKCRGGKNKEKEKKNTE